MIESDSVGDAFWPEDWRALPPASNQQKKPSAVLEIADQVPMAFERAHMMFLRQPKAAARSVDTDGPPTAAFLHEQQQSQVLDQQKQCQRLVQEQMEESGRGDL